MRADDVHTLQNRNGFGRNGAVDALGFASIFAVAFEHSPDERFS